MAGSQGCAADFGGAGVLFGKIGNQLLYNLLIINHLNFYLPITGTEYLRIPLLGKLEKFPFHITFAVRLFLAGLTNFLTPLNVYLTWQ